VVWLVGIATRFAVGALLLGVFHRYVCVMVACVDSVLSACFLIVCVFGCAESVWFVCVLLIEGVFCLYEVWICVVVSVCVNGRRRCCLYDSSVLNRV